MVDCQLATQDGKMEGSELERRNTAILAAGRAGIHGCRQGKGLEASLTK
jgi:hypothetical protein